jgi:hypothetical protein
LIRSRHISAITISLIIHCTIRVFQVSDVLLVRGQLWRVKISEPEDGGGKIRIKRNVDYILPDKGN